MKKTIRKRHRAEVKAQVAQVALAAMREWETTAQAATRSDPPQQMPHQTTRFLFRRQGPVQRRSGHPPEESRRQGGKVSRPP